jgi:hypothetical protein
MRDDICDIALRAASICGQREQDALTKIAKTNFLSLSSFSRRFRSSGEKPIARVPIPTPVASPGGILARHRHLRRKIFSVRAQRAFIFRPAARDGGSSFSISRERIKYSAGAK